MIRRFKQYAGIFRSWIGSTPNVNLSKAEYAEIILNNSIHIDKSPAYDYMKPWLAEGLLTSTGRKWHNRRKMLTPAFHFKILDNSLRIFDLKARMFIDQLNKIPIAEVFDMYPYITHCTLDIICETAMGIQLNSMDDQNNEYVDAIYTVTDIALQRMIKPWYQPSIIFNLTQKGRHFHRCLGVLHDFTSKVIRERRHILNKANLTGDCSNEDALKEEYKEKKTFLDLLLEASKVDTTLTDEDIREEVDTFLFEGHDTTTAAICWCLFLLGNHLDIQDRVYEEINDAFQDHEGPINMEILGKLKLLERCIKETLRLYPSVPIVARQLQKDINIGGYLVPAGCTVNLYIYVIHRDPRYYNTPEKFDPDRFLPENTREKHAYAYIPFSAGPRNCIGQKYAMLEGKALLAYILKRFKVKAVETEKTVRPVIDLILRPLNGLPVSLEPRKL
ncbi:hypothetical protein Trydic_g19721 [Trypoxylus dichotomus]